MTAISNKVLYFTLALGLGLGLTVAGTASALTKEEVAEKLQNVDASNLFESPLPGVYEVRLDSQVAYVTEDGRFLFDGELYDLDSGSNLTEKTRSVHRQRLVSGVPDTQMLVFADEDVDTKHIITVFTDIDCGYCRQLHREIDTINAMGIEVHYLFYPRTGPDTESWYKADKVWCASNRNEAFTNATVAGAVPETSCDDTPVASHYDLAKQSGVSGTPAIIAANGDYIGGYLAPAALLDTLESLAE